MDLGATESFVFPFRLGFLPSGFDISGVAQSLDGGITDVYVELDDDPSNLTGTPPLTVNADVATYTATDFTPNTTVGRFQAELTVLSGSGTSLTLFAYGFLITLSVTEEYGDRIDEAELRRIAVELVVIPGAASDDTLWTDDPLG